MVLLFVSYNQNEQFMQALVDKFIDTTEDVLQTCLSAN